MEPPAFTDLRTYGAHLGDVSFWEPYVRTILARHRLARQGARGVSAPSIVSGFVGTFPTFLVGEVVIKLFGGFPSWRTCHDAELAAHLLLAEHPSIPAPELLAHGRLDDDPEAPWPYLVTRRLSGVAWRDADLLEDDRRRVVAALGPIVREIHELRPPAQVWPNRPLAHRASVVERHLAWGTLPRHLIEQI
ncbi:MAG TPA: phosphotransferase, partial [Actinopolymorphaceae bacterium]